MMQNTIDDAIAILQAFKEGRTIEYLNSNGEWAVTENPAFNFHYFRYRIKPEKVKIYVHKRESGSIVAYTDDTLKLHSRDIQSRILSQAKVIEIELE